MTEGAAAEAGRRQRRAADDLHRPGHGGGRLGLGAFRAGRHGASVDETPAAAWRGLEVWRRLPEWEEEAPPPPPGNKPVHPTDARHRLADLLGEDAEAAAQPGGLRVGRRRSLRPARRRRRAAFRAGRGGHRRRQDAGLYRAGQPVGRDQRRAGLDFHLHPQPAAPDRRRARPALSRTPASSAARW